MSTKPGRALVNKAGSYARVGDGSMHKHLHDKTVLLLRKTNIIDNWNVVTQNGEIWGVRAKNLFKTDKTFMNNKVRKVLKEYQDIKVRRNKFIAKIEKPSMRKKSINTSP